MGPEYRTVGCPTTRVSGRPAGDRIGGVYSLSGFTVQADNNDEYLLECWNGHQWQPAWAISWVSGWGMSTRAVTVPAPVITDKPRFRAITGAGISQ